MPLLTIGEPIKQQITENEEQEIAIGIDLGTTNSLVAISNDQKPEVFFDDDQNFMQPSIVTLVDGRLIAGNEALKVGNEKIYSVKRLMGRGFDDFQNHDKLHFKIVDRDKQIRIDLEGKEFSAPEISAEILKTLKRIAQNNLKKSVSKAVITVPAYFDEAARNATKQAANLAGLEVLRLISEPTAAAVAYGLDSEAEGKFLVFDLGGGTFDVSVLELSKGVFKVIGVGGDANLGGDDFDHLILDEITAKNNLKNLSISELQHLKLIAKKIKEDLSKKELIEVDFTAQNQKINFKLSQDEFEKLSESLVQKTIKITQKLLSELDLEIEEIKSVILVGGSTRLNLIRKKLAENFGQDKILANIDPDKIVALGAAIQAENLTKKNSGNLLLDVIPLSLGIEMMGGIVDKIIERNSTIPTSAAKEFTTYADNQTAMKLHIVQGERELAKDCRSLARFEIKNIPALKAGVARVRVIFKVDADGLLTVSATETLTEETVQIEVKPTFGLQSDEIKNMLLESLKNSKSDMEERLLTEAKVEAGRNILAIKAALVEDKEFLDDELVLKTNKQIAKLEEAVKSNVQERISLEAEHLERFAEAISERTMNKVIGEKMIGKKIDEL